MARILYGVQGNGRGHAIRALTVARHYPQHEFLFVTHTEGVPLLSREFRMIQCRNPELLVRSHRVAILDVTLSNLRFWLERNEILRSLYETASSFNPDVAISDYEYFVPLVARRVGIPCLSLDHQHIVTFWTHDPPVTQLSSYVGAYMAARFLFSRASNFLVVSFFKPPSRLNNRQAKHVPPLLRESVLERRSEGGDHVVAYQSCDTFPNFVPFLKEIKRPVMVYGMGSDYREDNLTFKKPSEEGFLSDLASCSYVICGGGHTLISEALFYGKPVISFPVGNLFEQFLNAHYLEKLGYGRCVTGFKPGRDLIGSFELELERYRERIAGENFCGNEEIFSLLDHFIRYMDIPEEVAGRMREMK